MLQRVPFIFCPRKHMLRQKRKASGFDQNHPFWPEALGLWRQGYSNTQVAAQAQGKGYDLNEDQVRYARNRYWTADELPARGAKWLREAVREATEVYPNALEQQQALFSENYEVFLALKQRLLSYLNGTPPADELELAQMKVLLDSYARQGRLLNETNDTITVLQAKLGRLMPEAEPLVSEDIVPASIAEAEQWQG
jgi:Zn-dependent M32 family carboxypeptidase